MSKSKLTQEMSKLRHDPQCFRIIRVCHFCQRVYQRAVFVIFPKNESVAGKEDRGCAGRSSRCAAKDDLGIGDVEALREFIDWAAEIGFKLVQLLPINETGGDNSPYNAISAMAIEPTTLHLAPGSPKDLTRQDFDITVADVDLAQLRQGFGEISTGEEIETSAARKGVFEFREHANKDRR